MRSALRRIAAMTVGLLLATTAAADGPQPRVVAVPDGATLYLDRAVQGTTVIRLAGIDVPGLGPAGDAEPLAAEARAALSEIAGDRHVQVATGRPGRDRYGRLVGQAYRADGLWLQGAMLTRGLARVRVWGDPPERIAEMLALESQARAHGRGLWSHPAYAVRTAETIHRHINSFQIVEGRVQRAAAVRGRVFLNYGADWRTDFTVAIAAADLSRFAEAGLDPLRLEGRRIRVRGWVRSWNGPLIDVTHPAAIEILEAPMTGPPSLLPLLQQQAPFAGDMDHAEKEGHGSGKIDRVERQRAGQEVPPEGVVEQHRAHPLEHVGGGQRP
ncbi:MAG: thermonuclease family protein [Rhodospirillales bacterium]|nr:MAG: thermonuclease family protein [Rhodospirillales bacterium]